MERIVVIDDSKITQMLVGDVLAGQYALNFYEDGRNGIDAIMEQPPDLILLDIRLPNMDGLEICKILKDNETTREIPVIFITSLDSETERVRGFEAGAEDYVVKPFCLEELLARVRVHLASRRVRIQAVDLERLNTFKEMAVALNHEINNPLTSLFAYLHILQREIPGASDVLKESLAGIQAELGRIKQIVEKLAQSSKVVSTKYNDDITMNDPLSHLIFSLSDPPPLAGDQL